MALPRREKGRNGGWGAVSFMTGTLPTKPTHIIRPCPICGAKRYEKCFRTQGQGNGKFIWVMDNVHDERKTEQE